MQRLTKTIVESGPPGWLWDSDVPGLGVRVLESGARSFVFRYGSGRRGGTKRVTLGRYPALTLEQARKTARLLIGAKAEGRDPAQERARTRDVPTLAEFAERYMEEYAKPRKKASTLALHHEILKLHVLPALGARPMDTITRTDVAKMHASKHAIPVRANRCVSLLSHLYTIAHRWGVLHEQINPARGVVRFTEVPRQRYLTAEELARVGAELAGSHGFSAAALKVLILTGARRNEILGLRWEDVDLEAGIARLRSRKSGALQLTLPGAACEVMRDLIHVDRNPYVFPGRREGKHITGNSLTHAWDLVRRSSGVTDVRLHDLRHTFASVLAGRGVSLLVIGGLLGHTQAQTTKRYAHLADGPMRLAAEGAADEISAALKKK